MASKSKLPSIMRTVTPSQAATPSVASPASISERVESIGKSVRTNPSNDGGMNVIRVILIIAIVGFLAYNLYLYFTEGTDVLGKYFGMGLTGVAQGTEKVVDTVAEGTKDTISVAQNVTDKGLDVVAEGGEEIKERSESPIERNQDEEKKIEEGQNVDTESSFASSLKKTVKGGYCYIGTDRTYRSCVKINPGDVCMSNQIYPTKDICINPNLRR